MTQSYCNTRWSPIRHGACIGQCVNARLMARRDATTISSGNLDNRAESCGNLALSYISMGRTLIPKRGIVHHDRFPVCVLGIEVDRSLVPLLVGVG
jgi:hypothetical protein